MKTLTEIGSWAGMVLLLLAFAGRRRLTERVYSAMNFVGALLVGIKCWETRTYAAAGLEGAWMLIAAWLFFKPEGKVCGMCQEKRCAACRRLVAPAPPAGTAGGAGE
jgi:hypothetical protein